MYWRLSDLQGARMYLLCVLSRKETQPALWNVSWQNRTPAMQGEIGLSFGQEQ